MVDPAAHNPDQDEVELATRETAGNLAEARTFAKEAGEDVDTGLASDEPEEIEALPLDEDRPGHPGDHTERLLDHGLEETFPASDPVAVTPRER